MKNLTLKSDAKGDSLLKILQNASIDWMHACGGKGRCTTCKAIVHRGAAHFEARTLAEERMARTNRLLPNERLACQAVPTDDIEISVPKRYQLPHITYTSA